MPGALRKNVPPSVRMGEGNDILIHFDVPGHGVCFARLISLKGEVMKWDFDVMNPGSYTERLECKQVPPGKYLLVIKQGEKVLQRYKVLVE